MISDILANTTVQQEKPGKPFSGQTVEMHK
jgi:hypothetical protein